MPRMMVWVPPSLAERWKQEKPDGNLSRLVQQAMEADLIPPGERARRMVARLDEALAALDDVQDLLKEHRETRERR